MKHVIGEPLNAGELAAFVAAVDSGSISGAADALELTQSAATKRVASLERRLGVRVLTRTTMGVNATAAGRVLYPEAQRALCALRDAAAVVASAAGDEPPLRLAASHTIGSFLLPGWLSQFRSGGGETRTQVEIVNSQNVLVSVRYGHIDIGFIESLDATEELEVLTILHDEIVVVVAADHPWARRGAVPSRWLAGERYLAREAGSGTRAVAADRLASMGVMLTPDIEVMSTQSLKRAVLDGGFTLISRLTVEAEVLAGTLRALPVEGVDLRRPLRAVRRRHPPPTGQAARLWRQLR